MKKLCCKDINPNTACDYEATGDTVTEVAEKMIPHARTAHADDVKDMTDEQMREMFEAKAHD